MIRFKARIAELAIGLVILLAAFPAAAENVLRWASVAR
jgi:hypothetical protein